MSKDSNVNKTEIDCRKIHYQIPGLNSDIRNILEMEREIIPIIFVPGIMGSRLRNAQGKKVWDPDAKIFMLGKYGLKWQNARKKKKALVGSSFDSKRLSVIEDDASHNKKFSNKNDKTRAERGWGGVAWSSYGEFLSAMQEHQWEPLVNLCFRMPVHAFGYNWTASDDQAGEELSKYIDKTLASYRGKGRRCEKVIIVTHSMGGLAARAACKLHGAEKKVLGVIHGVQPAMGSPAAYWRMKGGFERPHTIPDLDKWQWLKKPVKLAKHKINRILTRGYDFGVGMSVGLGNVTAWVLGSDGEEVTSLLGNMPGGLQLLPNKLYHDNDGHKGWLVFIDHQGKKTTLPNSDPYNEIYRRENVFYRLVNPDWLNPGGSKSHEDFEKSDWKLFLKYLSNAEQFHEDLGDKVHHDTYQFYSTGIASPDRVVFTRSLDTWSAKGKRMLDIVRNEWFDSVKSTAKDETRDAMFSPLIKPVKEVLTKPVSELSWQDIVYYPLTVVKHASDAVRQVLGVVASAAKDFGPALPGIAKSLPEKAGIGMAKTAAKTAVGVLVRDCKYYIDKGGYRDKVDDDDNVVGKTQPEVVYVITMELPDGSGDGTVPESSGSALELVKRAYVNRTKKGKRIRRTFSVGDADHCEQKFEEKNAPRTKSTKPADFEEGWFDRGHEPVYKCKSARHITFTAIESLCRRRIEALGGS